MDAFLVVVLIFVFFGIIAVLIVLIKNSKLSRTPDASESSQRIMLDVLENLRKDVQESSGKSRQELQQRLDSISDQMQKGMQFSSKTLQDQFKQTHGIIQEVTTRLTKLDETNQQVLGFSKQMQSLENILKNPKHRGILGEYFLETILSHVLPPSQYKMQYKFQNGEIVDAIIRYRDQLIPIDAKFSLEKYNRIMETEDPGKREKLERDFKLDLKSRIDETSKYIRPSERTTDFAFMYIPAEGIYYNLLVYKVGTLSVNAQDLQEYAHKKHVIIVSPTTFFAYLQTVLQGLKAAQTEKDIKQIMRRIEDLGRHLKNYQTYYDRVGAHLGTAVNTYNIATKELSKVNKDIYRISDGRSGAKDSANVLLDKPQQDQ